MITFFICLVLMAILTAAHYLDKRIQQKSSRQLSVVLNPHFSLDQQGRLLLDNQRLHDERGSEYADDIQEIFFTLDGDIYVLKLFINDSEDEIAWEHYVGSSKTEDISDQEMKSLICQKVAFSAADFFIYEANGKETVTIVIKYR